MADSELAELKKLIERTNRDVSRLLTWAEGDKALGSPSVKDQIDTNAEQIREVRKLSYENRHKIYLQKNTIETHNARINTNEEAIKDIKKLSSKFGAAGGAAGGGFIAATLKFLEGLFS